jgi:glycosyltransferase involved in cell wall biosynthesis
MLDIVSLNPDYWDGPRHNRHYFCQELSTRARVLFASPPFNIARVIDNLGKWTLPKSGVRVLSPTLISYTPSKLLFTNHRFPSADRWMRERRVRTMRQTMKTHGMRDPVLLVWHPQYRDLIGEFGERLVVYYVYDQYTGYSGGTPTQSPAELELIAKADIVFVLSRQLFEDKKRHASKIVHLANAVDFELFSRSRDARTAIPADLAMIPGPRIGYIGTINEKVNLPVLEGVATAHPEWSVVLIGRENYSKPNEKQRFLDLVARPNLHWLPYKPYDQVPSYIKGLDVCMMCYVVNGWTYYGDPSKLHEYLASGKPTIGNGLASIRDFADVVAIAETPEEWIAAIEAGLRESDQELTRRRIATAKANSYQARIDVFLDTIGKYL